MNEHKYWMVWKHPGDGPSGNPIGLYHEGLGVPILMVFTSRENASQYMTSELAAGAGAGAMLRIDPIDREKFKAYARTFPECYLDFDVRPDTQMPNTIDQLTPIQEFAAKL